MNIEELTIEGLTELEENFKILDELEYENKENNEIRNSINYLNHMIKDLYKINRFHKRLLYKYYEELNKYSNSLDD